MKEDLAETIVEIRNKLVAPMVALHKLSRKEAVPEEFIKLTLKELNKIVELLGDLKER